MIAGGFAPEEEIVELTIEQMQDEQEEEVDESIVRNEVSRLLEDHRRRQAGWPRVTDCDRLIAAFGNLEKRGIICRENFTCCMTCGTSEIGGEMEGAGGEKKIKGYVFYHMQDLERAADGEGLMLAYGAYDGGKDSGVEIGKVISNEIQSQGLSVNWDGTFDQRIHVVLDWKRRR
jgi:hypothetical protein